VASITVQSYVFLSGENAADDGKSVCRSLPTGFILLRDKDQQVHIVDCAQWAVCYLLPCYTVKNIRISTVPLKYGKLAIKYPMDIFTV